MAAFSQEVLERQCVPSPLEEVCISLALRYGIADADGLLRAMQEQENPDLLGAWLRSPDGAISFPSRIPSTHPLDAESNPSL